MIGRWIADTVQKILFLSRDTEENKSAVKKLREEVDDLADEVKRLSFELERLKDITRYEHENFRL